MYFMRHKSKTFVKFKCWKAEMDNQTERKIKCLKSHNGTEYTDSRFMESGMGLRDTSHFGGLHNNGVKEMMNRSTAEKAQCLILNAR